MYIVHFSPFIYAANVMMHKKRRPERAALG
jgi:hypothetical protein